MFLRIDGQPFDIKQEYVQLAGMDNAGAVVTFSGRVRSQGEHGELIAMELECYPGMTENCITAIAEEAQQRWELLGVRIIHRIGLLQAGEEIVFVGVSARHRLAAFAAAEFIMDYLKTQAPFWKKEITADAEYWVEQNVKDQEVLSRWVP